MVRLGALKTMRLALFLSCLGCFKQFIVANAGWGTSQGNNGAWLFGTKGKQKCNELNVCLGNRALAKSQALAQLVSGEVLGSISGEAGRHLNGGFTEVWSSCSPLPGQIISPGRGNESVRPGPGSAGSCRGQGGCARWFLREAVILGVFGGPGRGKPGRSGGRKAAGCCNVILPW